MLPALVLTTRALQGIEPVTLFSAFPLPSTFSKPHIAYI